MKPKCIAFDCFGTVFDMEGISREQIQDYVRHVRQNDFRPYTFPREWYKLKAHPDAAEGIHRLKEAGFVCVTLSNGSADLLKTVSDFNGIEWHRIIDLASHCVYKPHLDAYRMVEKETGFKPGESLMVTANPTFGDIEGSEAIGMPSQTIRVKCSPATIIELAESLGA